MSVPYAMKALDAETIGGKPVSSFMLAPASSGSSGKGPAAAPGTITGTGTADFVPVFTGTTTIGNSKIFQTVGGNVGIATTTPAAKLDVKGTGDVRDTLTLFPKLTHPTLTVSGTAFAVSNTGKVTFVAGQNFPGTGTVTSVGSGAGLTGGPITHSGTLSIKTGGVTNAMLANSSLTVTANSPLNGGGAVSLGGSTSLGLANCAANQILQFIGGVWKCANPAIGTVTSVGSGLGLTGGPITGTGTLSIDTTVVPQLGTANLFLNNNAISVNNANPALGVSNPGGDGVDIGVGGSYGIHITGAGFEDIRAEGSFFPLVGFGGSGEGVFGATATDNNFSAGIVGIADGSTQRTIGVEGQTFSNDGSGVLGIRVGQSTLGSTFSQVGAVWGDTNQTFALGVMGSADDGFGVIAENNSPSGDAALFADNSETTSATNPVFTAIGLNFGGQCTIDVSGDLSCTGVKNAVVPVDGGARKVALNAIEAPENWFEDAGSAHLSNGEAVVNLEQVFGQTINAGVEYHVFLTPNGDCKGLYVAEKSATSFVVRELGGGTSSIVFDYRIMAKRKGYESVRLVDKTKEFSRPLPVTRSHLRKSEQPPRPDRNVPSTVHSVTRISKPMGKR
jgi:hypothetical protein